MLQLSYGLSTEYTKRPQAREDSDFNAERHLFSKYYIAQIMQLGEEGIHDAWNKVSRDSQPDSWQVRAASKLAELIVHCAQERTLAASQPRCDSRCVCRLSGDVQLNGRKD